MIESNDSNNAMPLRLVYSVGLEEGIDPDTLENVSDEYIAANTVDGKVNFYSNAYTAADEESSTEEQIGAQVTFTPALIWRPISTASILTENIGGKRVMTCISSVPVLRVWATLPTLQQARSRTAPEPLLPTASLHTSPTAVITVRLSYILATTAACSLMRLRH